MKSYQVRIPPAVASYLRHLSPDIKIKIRRALEELEKAPYLGKPLKDQLAGLFSLRVSRFRIIYQIHHQEILIEVVEIAERKIVYQKVAQLWQRLKK